MSKKVLTIVLTLAAIMAFAAVVPASAYNFNVPENVAAINYSNGGEIIIQTPASWPGGDAAPATALKIEATEIEAGFFGFDQDGVTISVPYGSSYLPVAFFTTNPNTFALTFVRKVLSGLPVAASTNSKNVSESDLKVERHGNRITTELKAPQTIMWSKVGGGYTTVTIPAFKFEIDKVGGSIYRENFHNFSGYPKASRFTSTEEEIGFNAKGVFTCTGWSNSMSNCFIVMHGITTYFFPEDSVRNHWTGGAGNVLVPSTWPLGGRHYDNVTIYAQHVEAGSLGTGDIIVLFVPYSPGVILPMACFTTNPTDAVFEKALRKGTPAGNLADNTRWVSESVLKIERHRNHVTVELSASQTILWPNPVSGGAPVSVTIPAFTMELDQVGGLEHTYTVLPLTSPPTGSGYTVYDYNRGFDATGVFTCTEWSYVDYPLTVSIITEHGINTNVPP